MKNKYFLLLAAILLVSSASLMADDWDSHPVLTDNFILSLGAFRSDSSFKLRSSRLDEIGEDIDFGNSIGVDKSSTLLNAQLRWKFGKNRKWSIWGQYFKNDATGESVLTKDVEWQDIIFREGTFVDGGVSIEVIRAFLGRSFIKNEKHDFGLGIGIHNLDLGAYIGGEIIVNDETTGYKRYPSDASQILPNLGGWYTYGIANRWALHARVDWISANVGDYDGTLWNTNLGINFQAWRHVGFDLSYQYFNLDLNVDKSDWDGGAEMTYSGPVLGMIVNW